MSPYPVPQPIPEGPALARLSAQVEALRGELVPRLDRIERQVERTNGRVTALELHDAREAGADEARGLAGAQNHERRRRLDDRRWAVRMLALTVIGSIVSGITVAVIVAAVLN